MKNVVIIGGKDIGIAVVSVIDDCRNAGQKIQCVGFLNDYEKEICGYKVIGAIKNNDWEKLPEDYLFITAFSNLKYAYEKHELIKKLRIPASRYVNIIHPSAVISSGTKLGYGLAVLPFAFVGPNSELGNFTSIRAHGCVSHDCVLGESTFISNNATVNGSVKVGNGVHIGANASIMEELHIGNYSLIGMGAAVIRDVPDFAKVVGNPARIINN